MSYGRGTGAVFGDVQALEMCAERAGAAMACTFSSSDEYESALIAERRAAGIYGPRRYRRAWTSAAAVAAAVAILILLLT